MSDFQHFREMQLVTLEAGDGSARADGFVMLASGNGRSLMVAFDDEMFLGWVGSVPLLWDEVRGKFMTLNDVWVNLRPR